MSIINIIAYAIHVISVIAILSLLILQWDKSPKKLNAGVLHAGISALIAGLVMVGIHDNIEPEEPLSNTKIGIKFLILLTLLAIGYRNIKKPELSKNVWMIMIGLTVTNIVIASVL